MEEIIIQFAGQINLILTGEILSATPIGRRPTWEFRLLNVDNNEIPIPMSSDEISNGTMTIVIANKTTTHPFWSMELINQENDIFRITTFPNRTELLTQNI